MATGWAKEGAVQEQIDASIDDAVKRSQARLPSGESLQHCADCGSEIPEARRAALPGVGRCAAC
jgi:phage/conjugal plasmid C-4 type zinc finger TraR family protein